MPSALSAVSSVRQESGSKSNREAHTQYKHEWASFPPHEASIAAGQNVAEGHPDCFFSLPTGTDHEMNPEEEEELGFEGRHFFVSTTE